MNSLTNEKPKKIHQKQSDVIILRVCVHHSCCVFLSKLRVSSMIFCHIIRFYHIKQPEGNCANLIETQQMRECVFLSTIVIGILCICCCFCDNWMYENYCVFIVMRLTHNPAWLSFDAQQVSWEGEHKRSEWFNHLEPLLYTLDTSFLSRPTKITRARPDDRVLEATNSGRLSELDHVVSCSL